MSKSQLHVKVRNNAETVQFKIQFLTEIETLSIVFFCNASIAFSFINPYYKDALTATEWRQVSRFHLERTRIIKFQKLYYKIPLEKQRETHNKSKCSGTC